MINDHGPSRVELRGFGFRHLIRDRFAIRGVDLLIEPGERVLLLGPSGAGKSTLLHAVAGLLDAESGDVEGSILIDGRAPTPASGGHGLSGTGILFQDPDSQLVMNRSGDEVAFGLENAGVPAGEIWPRVQGALDAVGFRYGMERSTQALSGGERQRLVLAGVLALRPRLLLLDEPTANLDPDGSTQVMSALAESIVDRSATVIMIEHKITRALPLVDRVVVIDPQEGVIADGNPEHVLSDQHDHLAAGGVWVDDQVPWSPGPKIRPTGPELLRLDAPRRRYPGPSTSSGIGGTSSGIGGTSSGIGGTDSGSGGTGSASGPLLPEPVDLTITGGSVTAVIGANGVGKSTLGGMIAGLTAPQSGAVVPGPELITGLPRRYASRPVHRWPSERLAARIGTVFQNPEHQFLTGRVRDEITLGPRRSRQTYAERADELLERLGLGQLADANPFTLSGGEKRRLSVATALAGRPRVVVLDEPTFGQDRRTWIELAKLFSELADHGTALIFVTHDQLLTSALADKVVELRAVR